MMVDSFNFSRIKIFAIVVSALTSTALMTPLATAGVTNERNYTLGDEGVEDASPGIKVGSGAGNVAPGSSLDSGDPNDPVGTTFLDLPTVVGNPTYVVVTDRPGATPGSLGATFNGTTDALSTNFSMNAPTQMWDNTTFFPSGEFAANYEGIFSHGIQLWAKPTVTAARQDLVLDTEQHGIYITENDTWGLQFRNANNDSGVSVASTTDGNGWAHVMAVTDPDPGNAANGLLLVNGVAVAIQQTFYDPSTAALSIGSNLAGDGNFYNGVLDDVRIFLWGDNSDQLGEDGVAGGTNGAGGLNADGRDWGTFDLSTDNDFIASLNLQDGDATGDGLVMGDGSGGENDDVAFFIDHYRDQQLLGDAVVGDLNSRQNQADFNYDGLTDIADWLILRANHPYTGLLGSKRATQCRCCSRTYFARAVGIGVGRCLMHVTSPPVLCPRLNSDGCCYLPQFRCAKCKRCGQWWRLFT